LSVRLDDPFSGRSVWGTEIERGYDSILTARAEIVSLLAARLSLSVPQPGRNDARPINAEAQDAYLRGVVEAASGLGPRVADAVRLFERAIALEPAWAEPLAQLASAQQLAAEFADPAERSARAETVRGNALRAIELDPSEPVSYTALAAVQAYHDWDFSAAERTLRQSIEMLPRSGATRSRLALLLAARGRLPEAVAEAQLARDLEPLLPERHGSLGFIRYYARDFNGALDDLRRALAIAPRNPAALFGTARVLALSGRVDEGRRSLQAAIDATGNTSPALQAEMAFLYSLSGQAQEAEEIVRTLRAAEEKGSFVSVDNYAYIEANLGRLDEAFALLDQAIDRRMTSVLWLAVDPRADRLRADPRFARAIARMGIAGQ
jgi:tetratricopeptide (TPR) repeat protein